MMSAAMADEDGHATACGADPTPEALEEAGLRYVSDGMPGIARRRAGKGLAYRGPDGQALRDADTLRWIRSLAIPPAWRDVWISPFRDGHLLATGRDEKGRKQYRYHPRWRAIRDAAKFEHVLAFGKALPRIRAAVEADLAGRDLGRRRVLATVVRLLETTLIRVGNDEYAKANKSYGLTTLKDRHVKAEGSTLRFRFRGKAGKRHEITLKDRRPPRRPSSATLGWSPPITRSPRARSPSVSSSAGRPSISTFLFSVSPAWWCFPRCSSLLRNR